MNLPVFLLGLFLLLVGIGGLAVWARIVGLGTSQADGAALGFAPAGSLGSAAGEDERFAYSGKVRLGSSLHRRLLSLAGIVAFIAAVSAGAALVLWQLGKIVVKLMERYFLQGG